MTRLVYTSQSKKDLNDIGLHIAQDNPQRAMIYTNSRGSEPISPLAQPDRHDAPELIDEAVPGMAAVTDGETAPALYFATRNPLMVCHPFDNLNSVAPGGARCRTARPRRISWSRITTNGSIFAISLCTDARSTGYNKTLP